MNKTIKYYELNKAGTAILGDHLIVYEGKTYLTKEDLKLFPDVVTLSETRL